MRNRLEVEFDREMQSILERERAIDLNSVRFGQMVARLGGVETAHQLLKPGREFPPGTFSYLRDRGRLDLALEYYVVMEKYKPLFSEPERDIAAFRLRAGE